jgi:hypothetical protein
MEAVTMTASLTVVHITDLHVGTRFAEYVPPRIAGFSAVPISTMKELANIAARGSKSVSRGPCCCIVSGDLTAFGGEQEFVNAATYISASIVYRQKSVGLGYGLFGAGALWDGVLGNHDIWGGRTSFVAWYSAFKKKRQAEIAAKLSVGVRCGQFDFGSGLQNHIDIGSLRVRFYMLDSTLPGWRNVFARGRVSLNDLRTLEECVHTDEEVDKQTANIGAVLRIAVLHHTVTRPWSGGLLNTMVLENADDVRETLARCNFGLVLCGHDHEFSFDALDKDLYEVNAGTALQAIRGGGTNWFAVVEIHDPDTNKPPSNKQTYVKVSKFASNYDLGRRISDPFVCKTHWYTPVRVRPLRRPPTFSDPSEIPSDDLPPGKPSDLPVGDGWS